MKTRIFNLIILDESGSMQLIKEEAINGVNETVQTILHAQQRHKEQEHFVSLVTFNIDTRTIWECIPANEIKEISRTDYYPNCSTALYDAMGMSLNALLPHVAPNDKILVTIVTDGEENASKEYNKKSIKALVEELKNKGWVFVYIGANQDVKKVTENISIHNVMNFNATSEGTQEAWRISMKSSSQLYSRISDGSFCAETENECFFNEKK